MYKRRTATEQHGFRADVALVVVQPVSFIPKHLPHLMYGSARGAPSYNVACVPEQEVLALSHNVAAGEASWSVTARLHIGELTLRDRGSVGMTRSPERSR